MTGKEVLKVLSEKTKEIQKLLTECADLYKELGIEKSSEELIKELRKNDQ
jgi:arsenate reductase-like glutaredoxin family protein